MPVLALPPSLGRGLARRLRNAGHAPARVMAHDAPARVQDLHAMLAGLRILLGPGGVLALDLPHLLPRVLAARFDALRHDRLSWFTLAAAGLHDAGHAHPDPRAGGDPARTTALPAAARRRSRRREPWRAPCDPLLGRSLRAARAELIGYDTAFFADCLATTGGLPEAPLDAQHAGDIRDLPAALLDGVDAVVHLAAISNDPMGTRREAATGEISTRASIRLAALAHQAGVLAADLRRAEPAAARVAA